MSGKREGSLILDKGKVRVLLDNTGTVPWSITWGDTKPVKDASGWLRRVWSVTINGHTFPFHTGTARGVSKSSAACDMGATLGPILDYAGFPSSGTYLFAPDVRDALGSLFSDAECVEGRGLDEFAADFGITTPSKAVAMFQACHESNAALSRILGADREAYREALENGGHL